MNMRIESRLMHAYKYQFLTFSEVLKPNPFVSGVLIDNDQQIIISLVTA